MAEQSPTEADALMSAYLDEELAPEEAAKVEKLLAESPEARAELSGLQNMLKLVKALPEVVAPPDFYEKVARKIRRRRVFSMEVLWMLILPFQVLSVVLILVVAATYMLLHLDNDPSVKLEKDPTAQLPPPEAPPAATPGP
jgi:anti-sigma factor RsiW